MPVLLEPREVDDERPRCRPARHPRRVAPDSQLRTANCDLRPPEVVPGTSKRIWSMCTHRHEWQVSGDNRVRLCFVKRNLSRRMRPVGVRRRVRARRWVAG